MTDYEHPYNALPRSYRLDEYELVRVLGAGGFGITYLGFDDDLAKGVAIKEYPPSALAVRTDAHSVVPKASTARDDFAWGWIGFCVKCGPLKCIVTLRRVRRPIS